MTEAASPPDRQMNANRAVAVYDAMQRFLYVRDGSALYREVSPWNGGHPYAYLWEFSRALAGTLALAGVPRSLVGGVSYAEATRDRFKGLERYWNGRSSPPAYDSNVPEQGGGDMYYDDNAWLSLAFVQQYRMGLTTSLARAQQLFELAKSGWDTVEGDPAPGGVSWVQQKRSVMGRTNHDRGAGVTGGGAELGFHLRELTGAASYEGDGAVVARPALLGATNMLNWVNGYLDSGHDGTGLYWNAVRGDGTFDANLWSYVQGVMIGASVLRYRLTDDPASLDRAIGIARKTLSHYGDFTGQPPSFNAMLFQDLLMLYPYAAPLQSAMMRSMQSYGDWAWNNASVRDPKTGLFYFTEGGQPNGGTRQATQLRDQGAMVQVYALLAWEPDDYYKLT